MISQEDIDAFKENELVRVKYLILKDDGYDGWNIHYCDSKEELGEALWATDYMHFIFPIRDIEVYEVTRELTVQELLEIRNTNAKES
jgi:hypothetical protein